MLTLSQVQLSPTVSKTGRGGNADIGWAMQTYEECHGTQNTQLWSITALQDNKTGPEQTKK